MSKLSKGFCIAGSLLLLVMAGFHGSGYSYIDQTISASNAPGFLKQIVPALFVHPSIHLLGLTAFGVLPIFQSNGARGVLVILTILVLVDATLAFSLGGMLPGALLSIAAICFGFAGWKR